MTDTNTVPEVFAEVVDPWSSELYVRIYSALFILNIIPIFLASEVNDLAKFVNLIAPRLPADIYDAIAIENGLHAVHYALREGPDMFRRNYCQ